MPQTAKTIITAALAAAIFSSLAISGAGAARRHAQPALTSGGPAHAQPGDTCLGASACNSLIAECAGEGLDFKVKQVNGEGQPTYGHCVKAWD